MLSFLGSIFFFLLFFVLIILLVGLGFVRSLFGFTKHKKTPRSESEQTTDSDLDPDKQRRKETFKKTSEYVDFEEVEEKK